MRIRGKITTFYVVRHASLILGVFTSSTVEEEGWWLFVVLYQFSFRVCPKPPLSMDSDSETPVYEKLISQCRSNDVDVKVDSLTKLQAEFDKGNVKVSDPDAIINILKSSLRTSNLHLTNAALSALPTILPLLISQSTNQAQLTAPSLSSSVSTTSVGFSGVLDVVTLRQALNSFLPAGGVIDRLGDKERAQLKARDTLIILGGFAFRSGSGSAISKAGKGVETPIAIFERLLKEVGLASKVWKVREQSILTLVHIRRTHHLFPIRPYLSLLVDCLEDTDPHVRDCARHSIVELFSGPGVSDAARADLKKELMKKGVRKTIVDGVLSKLLAGSIVNRPQSREGSENGEGTNPSKNKEYVPPSMALLAKKPQIIGPGGGLARTVSQSSFKELQRPASRTAMASLPQMPAEILEIQPVYVASSRDLENEFAAMHKPFEGKETEHNWAVRDQSVQRVRGMLKGDVHVRFLEPFLIALKDGFIQWSLKALASLRTTVAVNACLLYVELATALGPVLDPFCEVLLTNLLRMANFTKKITAQHSQASVTAILARASAQPRLVLHLLWQTLQEKTVQARAFAVAHLKQFVEVHGQRSKVAIESSNSLEILERSLKRALADSNPPVRESARLLFWDFEQIWQERGHAIMETLDATARKQLEKACPNPNLPTAISPSTPKPNKKSSVAAAIAASRAKAKAIATAPPTLRHQATSASHTATPRRSGSPSTSPKNSTARPSSPQRTITSPPSPSRYRVASASLTRSASLTSVPNSHVRTLSSGSSKVARVPSPSLSDQSSQRRTSSRLVGSPTTSSIRKALQTALPASPPSSVGQVSPTPLGKSKARNVPLPLSQLPSQSLELANPDESLLIAQTVPIPEGDTDLEDECMSVNLMSFSAPLEMYPPIEMEIRPLSPDSKFTVSNALSSESVSEMTAGQPVVEDALRARAEQAESAAERLLELVEPEDEGTTRLLFKNSNGPMTAKSKAKTDQIPGAHAIAPLVTPNNRVATIMRRAALFTDSPAHGMRSSSLLDVLQSQKQETGWWIKRKALFSQASLAPVGTTDVERIEELKRHISALSCGDADTTLLKRLVIICIENSVEETPASPSSPSGNHPTTPSPSTPSHLLPSLHSDVWETNRLFEQFFNALITYLEPSRSEEELTYGLIIIWAILENQAPYLEGRESDLMSMILRVRYCNMVDVLEGTNAIRDALTTKLDPVYGLTTMHASLRVFYADAPPSPEGEEVKAATFAFGLMALGKYFLRLPAEIAEEELPRLKNILISALNDRSSLIVRESAAACIIAAQLVIRDETHLFALLDGLADEKKNLLTYLFDKHGARGVLVDNSHNGIDKLEKEIRRLDTRTSTPLRGGV